MKKNLIFTLFLLILLFSSAYAKENKTIKIACIGNSITYGANISNREKSSYPAQLETYLGEGYEVRNFGVNARTALTKGNYPYKDTDSYKEIFSYQPEILFIKLGTNDTKAENWKYKSEFLTDYQALIDSFQQMDSHPRIILLTPVRCFLPVTPTDINENAIAQEVIPMIEQLAWENKLEIVDLHHLFGDKCQQHLFPDQLHPSSIGAGMIAKKLYRYLTYTAKAPQKELEKALDIPTAKAFNFHGHQGYLFKNNDAECRIVKPAREAVGKPWVIRARFWGHEPQTDIAMLEHGFHIVYCDVADLYGSDQAVARWNSFYKRMVKAGFSKKVVLEGMSRGGLIVYNWAAQNPDKVACIYADAPAMDFKSWPMGKGSSEGSATDTQNLLKAYGFGNETEALNWKRNPVDCAPVMAKANIAILHVVGDADVVVPVAENTAIFEEEMKALHAPITVIHKPGIGHHPHSLYNPEPIVNFILKATGYAQNMCVHPIPGNEYRSAAGWMDGADWNKIAEDITLTLKDKQLELLLLGNSITQGWGGNRKAVTHKPGKDIMDKALGKDLWESAGISGDRTEHLLWRLRHGEYNASHPKNAIISIGINNLTANDAPEEVAEGIIAVAAEAKKQLPNTRIIVLGLLPAGKEANSAIRQKCDKIHQILAKRKWKGMEYINPTTWFTDADGNMSTGLYGGDYVHLTSGGYRVWAREIVKLIKAK